MTAITFENKKTQIEVWKFEGGRYEESSQKISSYGLSVPKNHSSENSTLVLLF